MVEATVPLDSTAASTVRRGHALWVRICHWIIAASFLTLATTGPVILMAHPRLYWGEVGNDLTPALLELPFNDNHRPEGWEPTVSFDELANTPVSANRTYEIFNQNGWGRSLHFLAAWFLVVAGAFYVLAAMATGHMSRDLLPRARELVPRALWQDLMRHLRLRQQTAGAGPPYGLLQRSAYAGVALIALPLMVATGMSMSPAITAAYPMLLSIFGGYQSARTIHFFVFCALILFLVAHVAMLVLTGFWRQMRAMILGS